MITAMIEWRHLAFSGMMVGFTEMNPNSKADPGAALPAAEERAVVLREMEARGARFGQATREMTAEALQDLAGKLILRLLAVAIVATLALALISPPAGDSAAWFFQALVIIYVSSIITLRTSRKLLLQYRWGEFQIATAPFRGKPEPKNLQFMWSRAFGRSVGLTIGFALLETFAIQIALQFVAAARMGGIGWAERIPMMAVASLFSALMLRREISPGIFHRVTYPHSPRFVIEGANPVAPGRSRSENRRALWKAMLNVTIFYVICTIPLLPSCTVVGIHFWILYMWVARVFDALHADYLILTKKSEADADAVAAFD